MYSLLVSQNSVKSTQITWCESGAGKNSRCPPHHAKGFKIYPKDRGGHGRIVNRALEWLGFHFGKICAVPIKQIVRGNSNLKRLELLQLSRGWWLGLSNSRKDRKSFCFLHGIIKIPSAGHNDVGFFFFFLLSTKMLGSRSLRYWRHKSEIVLLCWQPLLKE